MSIKINYSNKNYSIPNLLEIGRGFPFASTDHSFARKHLKIFKKNGEVYIRPFNETFINGEPVKQKKSYKLNVGDVVLMGQNESFTLLDDNTKNCERVHCERFSTGNSKKTIEYVLSASILAAYAYSAYKADIPSPLFYVWMLFGAIFTIALLKLIFYFIFKFNDSSSKNSGITNITYGDDGLTLYFGDGSNFSILYKDIKHARKQPFNDGIISIEVYDQEIDIFESKSKSIDTNKLIYDILNKHVPEKIKQLNSDNHFQKVSIPILIALAALISSYNYITNSYENFAYAGVLYIGVLAIAFNMLRNTSRQFESKKSQKLMLAVAAIAFSSISVFDQYKKLPYVAEAKKVVQCASIENHNCGSLSFDWIEDADYSLKEKAEVQLVAKKYCQTDEKACALLSKKSAKRDIASEK